MAAPPLRLAFKGCEKIIGEKLCSNGSFVATETSQQVGFVTGPGFSRAENAPKIMKGL
jgi:hypothetical protein